MQYIINRQLEDPPVQMGDSPSQICDSQDVQSVETLHGPELTETLVQMTLGTGARPRIPRMALPEEMSTEQVAIKLDFAKQQHE